MRCTESLTRIARLGLFLVCVTQALSPAWAQSPVPLQAPVSLEALFDLMSQKTRVHTTFTEKKVVKGRDAPVESSGDLLFEAPSRMVRRNLQPPGETLTLDGRQATVERPGLKSTVSLDDQPELVIDLQGLRTCLSGDRATLERLYHVSLGGSLAQWELTLVPRDARAAEQVEAIFLSGEQADIRIVQVLLSNGDSSLTHIARPVP